MSRIPDFLIQREKHHRQKNTCYAVFLTETPELSEIVVGENAWYRAEQMMKGKPHTHKGFTNQLDANQWMAEQKAISLTPGGVQRTSPKEDARAAYPQRFATARNAGRVVYNTDCSYDPGKSCGIGVWSSTHFIQQFIEQDPKLVNHQRGELLAILQAFKHYEANHMKDPQSKGLTIFSDSEYSVESVNHYARHYKKHRGANIWYTSKNLPVKHQDVISEILRLRTWISKHHKFCELMFVPRDLNVYADAISRGKTVEKNTNENGDIRHRIID
jgi:ribonuclease HI